MGATRGIVILALGFTAVAAALEHIDETRRQENFRARAQEHVGTEGLTGFRMLRPAFQQQADGKTCPFDKTYSAPVAGLDAHGKEVCGYFCTSEDRESLFIRADCTRFAREPGNKKTP